MTRRVFRVPAQYLPFITAQLALIVAEVGRDVSRRTDAYQPIRKLATVPDQFIGTETGTAQITVRTKRSGGVIV